MHVSGFWIEFLENNDIRIFLCRLRSIATHRDHFVRLSVHPSVTLSKAMFCRRHMHSSECCHYFYTQWHIMQYSFRMLVSPISNSWYCQFGTGWILSNCLFYFWWAPIHGYKNLIPSIVISNCHRWKPHSTKIAMCIRLSLLTSH